MISTKTFGAAILAAGIGAASVASASVVVTGAETGGDVVFSYSGSLNLGGLTFAGSNSTDTFGWIGDNGAVLVFYSLDDYAVFTGAFTTPLFNAPLSQDGVVSGDSFGFRNSIVVTKIGYTSGAAINGSLTFAGRTLADMGFEIGESFVTTLPSDTITVNIGSPAVVPLPAALPLLLAGLGAIGVVSRRKTAA